MSKNCIITWIDGTTDEYELEPHHIENLLELACVVSIKEIKKNGWR